MKYWWPALLFAGSILLVSEALAVQKEEGIVKIPSHHSVDETVDKLKTILKSKGVTLFALVDHSGEAEKVDMKMPPTKLLIFGNPKGGTPLMQDRQTAGIDLPIKALAWEDAGGKVWLSYNDPAWIAQRHGLGTASAGAVEAMGKALGAIAAEVTT